MVSSEDTACFCYQIMKTRWFIMFPFSAWLPGISKMKICAQPKDLPYTTIPVPIITWLLYLWFYSCIGNVAFIVYPLTLSLGEIHAWIINNWVSVAWWVQLSQLATASSHIFVNARKSHSTKFCQMLKDTLSISTSSNYWKMSIKPSNQIHKELKRFG